MPEKEKQPEFRKPGKEVSDIRPKAVDEFGNILPLYDEEPVEKELVDEFGHVGLMSRVEFTPEKRRREIGKLTQLFRERGWQGNTRYFGDMIDNGWTAGRITGPDNLLATHDWYRQQLGTTVELGVGYIPGFGAGGIGYDDKQRKWILEIDLTKPQFEFRRFEKYEDGYLLHEQTHEIQGRLTRLSTMEMLDRTYSAGEQEKYSVMLGFRDWERDFSMPPIFFTEEQQKKMRVFKDDKEIARQARDIHADATALRSGYPYVKVNERETALGLTPLTKTLLEYMFEALNYTPQNLEAIYGDLFDARDNIPILARFRALCNGLLHKTEDLTQEEKDSMIRCLDLVATRIKNVGVTGYTVADVKGDTIDDRIKWVMDAFDQVSNRDFRGYEKDVYDTLVDVYSKHLLFCMDRKKALENIGIGTLTEALNDETDPLMRTRVADYLGELGDVRALEPLRKRLETEKEDIARFYILNSIDSIFERNPESYKYPAAGMLIGELIHVVQEKLAGSSKDQLGRTVQALSDSIRRGRLSLVYNVPNSLHPAEGKSLLDYGLEPLRCESKALATIARRYPDEALRLFEPLTRDSNEFVRLWATEALSPIIDSKPEEVLGILKRMVRDKDSMVRSGAVNVLRGLIDYKPNEVLDILTDSIDDDYYLVRAGVARALGLMSKYHPRKALELLKQLTGDRDATVRECVADVLGYVGKFQSREALELLKPLARDREGMVYETSAASIVEFARPSEIQSIIDDPNVPERARRILRERRTKADLYFAEQARKLSEEYASGEREHPY